MYYSTDEALDMIKSITKITPSDEQMDVLLHKGGMSILASAGSGKTSVLTQLIAKRILTGEIQDVSKLLVTTYSVGGREELEERINNLMKRLGVKKRVEIRTLHSSYLYLLKKIGYNPRLMKGFERTALIKRAVADCSVRLDDEQLQNLDTMLSYQINNMLNDTLLYNSNAFNVDVTLNQYKTIASRFRELKINESLNDFDDLQMLVLNLLKSNDEVRKLFRAEWKYFYIDEFQDVSKIQFEIIKMMLQEPDNLVVIGDDDQCLIEGTKVSTENGEKNIESIEVGDKVLTCVGNGRLDYKPVIRVSSKVVDTRVLGVYTQSGKVITGTPDHLIFKLAVDKLDNKDIQLLMFGSDEITSDNINRNMIKYTVTQGEEIGSIVKEESLLDFELDSDKIAYNLRDKFIGNSLNDTHKYVRLSDRYFEEVKLKDIELGMTIGVVDSGKVMYDTVIGIDISHKPTHIVYDLTIPKTYNFIANGIITHNCVYQWRGADPNIIQNICGYYDITQFVLSTNYRCGGKIVENASVAIQYNNNRVDKVMKPFHSGGEILIKGVGNSMYETSLVVSNHVKELLDKGVDASDISILCRNNVHGIIIDNMISQYTLPRAVAEMKFSNHAMVKDIDFCSRVVEDRISPREASHLWKLVKFLSSKHASIIGNVMDSNGCSLAEALKSILVNVYDIDIIDSVRTIKLINQSTFKKLECFKDDAIPSMIRLYELMTENVPVERKFSKVVELYLECVLDFLYKDVDKSRMIIGVCDYMIDLMNKKGMSGFKAHMQLAEKQANMKLNSNLLGLNLSTMHSSKGKEWKHVIIVADDNISMPAFRGIKDMIKNGTDLLEMNDYIEQERRLHYVAMTRAKESLVVVTKKKEPGIFLLEAFGLIERNENDRMNSHVIDSVIGGYSSEVVDNFKREFGF